MRMLHRPLLQSALVGGLAALGSPAGATPYEVSLQVDANTILNSSQVNYIELPQASVSSGTLTSSSTFNENDNSSLPSIATASASGTAALGSLAASGTAYGDSFGSGNVTVEASFQDYLTVSSTAPLVPLQFEVVFDPVGSISASATAGGAAATLTYSDEASSLGSGTTAILPYTSVCTAVVNFTVSSPCNGSQAAPSEWRGFFTSFAGDQIQLSADITLQLLANGSLYCNPAEDPCITPVSSTATGDLGDAQKFPNRLGGRSR